MKTEQSKPKVLSANLFPVVGIGASAGGLDAFKRLLKAIPENSGMAFVLVQHLDPNHESVLPELLQKVTNIPVLVISDDIKVAPDHIYIIPSNKMLVANDGILQLSPRPSKNKTERNLPIDLFFTSLAEVHQSHAIGVILSGTGSDGTQGLKVIKEHGGFTFAQDELSAAYDGMPHSAVLADVVDFILPPEEITKKLLDIIPGINKSDEDLLNMPQQDENVLKKILSLLRIRKGTDFTYYKQTTIKRRIMRRVALNKIEDPASYLTLLRENKTEQDVLYQDLLIPVTSFFRDKKVFDSLCESVFPSILKNKAANSPFRVWVAGCSTGQEAYTIAICVKEFLDESGSERGGGVQIFATDVSEPAIVKARAGIYAKNELDGLTPHRLQNYFTKIDNSYQVNKQIREMCVFAAHNFLKDPPFGKVDLVTCRNVLIYLEPFLQKKALTTFHYALNEKGFLLLGKSETIAPVADLFANAGNTDKLFSRKNVPGRFMLTRTQPTEQGFQEVDVSVPSENVRTDFQKTADDIILSRYTPAGVVVNEAMEIVHFRGKTANFLEQLAGKPSHNLLQLAKSGLAFELRNILHKVKKEKVLVIKKNISLQLNSSQRLVTIEAMPLPNNVEPHYLILFHEIEPSETGPLTSVKNAKTKKENKDSLIEELEREIVQIREDMRSITEDQEAVNEELQSANEELLSSSEETQSLNEELESSKEELQSTNEELTVLNQEMNGLTEQITEARNYAESIIANIRNPLLVLDKTLRIKSANRAFYKKFQVDEAETEGRLIYQIDKNGWDIEALRTLFEQILPDQLKISDYEVRHVFPSIGERILLLDVQEIKRQDVEKLTLLVFEDVTEERKLALELTLKEKQAFEEQLKSEKMALKKIEESNKKYYMILMQSPFAFSIMKGKDMVITMANDSIKEFWGKGTQVEGKTMLQVLPELKDQPFPKMIAEVFTTGLPVYANEMLAQLNRNGKMEDRYFNVVYQPHLEADESISGVITIAHEVTTQVIVRKRMEAQATMVRNLLMNAPGFVCTLSGPDHVYEVVNERYQQLFGKRKIQGKPILEAHPELEGQGFDKLLDTVYNTGEPYVGIDIPITLARDENLEPEIGYFNFSYQPMYDEANKIYSILVFGYEVTDQVIAQNRNLENEQIHAKELEEKVQQRTFELSYANEELIKKNKELESFTYLSSHDLQEPLRKIQSYSSRILEKEQALLSDKGKEHFHRIQDAAGRMQTLLEDLLAYSHTTITERKFELTDLTKIVQDVEKDLTETIQEKNASIEVSELGKHNINPSQFRQVMHNLIGNALKFSKPGVPPIVTIKSKIAQGTEIQQEHSKKLKCFEGRIPSQIKYCHISVADNGIGFDPQYKDKVFEIFKRLHGKEVYTGTGIGLAIVKKIIENHNGLICATGEVNKGATFDIYIPEE